mgnify:CR=1 FL=1
MTQAERNELMAIIREMSYEEREVTLASGRKSNFYFDGKQTCLHAKGGLLVGKPFWQEVKQFAGPIHGVGGLTLGADPTQVVVWATPKDHETIKQLVKSIVEQPPELQPVMEVYTLEKVDALVAIRALEKVVRDAELSVGNNAGQLIAWARPKDQETIKEALAKLTEADLFN